MDKQFSHPSIAGGMATEFVSSGEFTPFVYGCSCIKAGTGEFNVTLDHAPPQGYVPVANAVYFATTPHAAVAVVNAIAPDQFTISLRDKDDSPIDAGVTFSVFPLPGTVYGYA